MVIDTDWCSEVLANRSIRWIYSCAGLLDLYCLDERMGGQRVASLAIETTCRWLACREKICCLSLAWLGGDDLTPRECAFRAFVDDVTSTVGPEFVRPAVRVSNDFGLIDDRFHAHWYSLNGTALISSGG